MVWLPGILLSAADSPAGEFRARTEPAKQQLLFTWCPFVTQKDAKRALPAVFNASPAVFSQEPGPWALISDRERVHLCSRKPIFYLTN